MSKKTTFFALVVASAGFFALPAGAFAQEIHFEPAEAFSISSAGGELRAEGEYTFTCTETGGSGKFDTGSTTTGTITMDYTGCHTSLFGMTIPCRSAGSAINSTIATSGTFHLITIGEKVPGVLLTTNELILEGCYFGPLHFAGSMIGTVVSPKCGESSRAIVLSFGALGSTQNHLTYTGVKYDLLSWTGSETEKTAARVETRTNTQTNVAKLNCT